MANDTGDAVMAEGMAAGRAGNTETPDTAELGEDEAAAGALAYKPHHRRSAMLDIHRRSRCWLRVAWGHPLPDPGPQPRWECPPVDGTQPPRRHPFRPAEHLTAHSSTRPHPSSGYQDAASEPIVRERMHRAVGLSDPSPKSQLGAHHPAAGHL
ncbi:hypothetical protein PIB30_083780 [Stylosanthes scabra]|uniref:Uncharacterized protein n=1 Tax=Stylosanthes scabra TaxID=79078 RepID=A0ABU6STQ7_9FABA|nr:hypothetical protein [Stylosanthes scabra]